MAKQLHNQKNLLVIKLSWREYVAATDTWGFCDLCQQMDFNDKDGYFIPSINQWYCENCYNAWYNSVLPREIDIQKERQNYNRMAHKLKQLGVWNDK